MTEPDSEIIDFYPEDFAIDLNGKKFAWQGVALLPFINSQRLLAAMAKKYPLLSPEVAARNGVGKDVLLVAEAHQALYDDIATNFYSKKQGPPSFKLNPRVSEGLAGKVEKNEAYLPHGSLTFPLESGGMPSLDDDRSISVHYEMPRLNHVHKSMLLRGVVFPPPALSQSDIEATSGRAAKSGRNHGGVPLKGDGRGRNSFNYNPSSNPYSAAPSRQKSYSSQNDYSNPHYSAPPPGWQPPPPGMGGFAHGPPPPPPPGAYRSYSQGQNPPVYPPPAPYGYSAQTGYGPPPGYGGPSDHRQRGSGGGYREQYGGQYGGQHR